MFSYLLAYYQMADTHTHHSFAIADEIHFSVPILVSCTLISLSILSMSASELKKKKSTLDKMCRSGESNSDIDLSWLLRCYFNSKVDWKTITTSECYISQHPLQHCLN
jgi:hypothetical protein